MALLHYASFLLLGLSASHPDNPPDDPCYDETPSRCEMKLRAIHSPAVRSENLQRQCSLVDVRENCPLSCGLCIQRVRICGLVPTHALGDQVPLNALPHELGPFMLSASSERAARKLMQHLAPKTQHLYPRISRVLPLSFSLDELETLMQAMPRSVAKHLECISPQADRIPQL